MSSALSLPDLRHRQNTPGFIMTFFQPSSHDTDTSKDQPPSDAEGEVKDIVYLNDSQNSRLISQLTKPVFIRSKDGLSAYNPPVAVVVDHFIQSFFSLHALLSSPPAAQFYAHQAPLSEKRISHIFYIWA
jgi:hypothetical protein